MILTKNAHIGGKRALYKSGDLGEELKYFGGMVGQKVMTIVTSSTLSWSIYSDEHLHMEKAEVLQKKTRKLAFLSCHSTVYQTTHCKAFPPLNHYCRPLFSLGLSGYAHQIVKTGDPTQSAKK
jgi:hypothetical protein